MRGSFPASATLLSSHLTESLVIYSMLFHGPPPHTHTEGSSYKKVYCADIMTTPCRTRDLTDLFTPDPKYC